MKKAIMTSLLALCVAIPALADDEGGLKEDKAPPPPHKIDDGYRGMEDARVMSIEHAKTMHDNGSVTLRGNLTEKLGDDLYRFRDKSDQIDVVIPQAIFDGRQVSPDQAVQISGSIDKKHQPPQVRVTHLQKQ